jgi:myo-inositol-1(or 4)-monophosphatase
MMPQVDSYIIRIRRALELAETLAQNFSPDTVTITRKPNSDPVTEADHALDSLLYQELLRDGEGWLSEETVDDGRRLDESRVWVVDPIDGTREFIQGIPEWVVSVALVADHEAVAGGILNPQESQLFLGGRDTGVTLNGLPTRVCDPGTLENARVLASRSELRQGRWKSLLSSQMRIIPVGSIAYKLALVASGRADAAISLAPKNEWDVAAGVILVQAAGGYVTDLSGNPLRFNQPDTLLNGVIAAGPRTYERIWEILSK